MDQILNKRAYQIDLILISITRTALLKFKFEISAEPNLDKDEKFFYKQKTFVIGSNEFVPLHLEFVLITGGFSKNHLNWGDV
ncbi:MAG: hypothetical protein AB8H03_20905 [Saprospiraceae bacterium]